jgi:hypothetical protein
MPGTAALNLLGFADVGSVSCAAVGSGQRILR